jgi:cystathionine beta-lyase
MPYDFDSVVDRHGSCSVKWDYEQEYTGMTGLLPLWVADMDFPIAPEVTNAIRRRAAHDIYGYVREPASYFEAARGWLLRRHGWQVPREWIVTCSSVLSGLSTAILAFTEPGDGIVIQPPVYYPFAMRIQANNRRVVENPLLLRDGRWSMDLDGLERLIDPRTRMLVLCSPHNPAGRVWERAALERLARICRERRIMVVSDEIHADLVMRGHRHMPIASLSEESAANTVTLVAPTKTFNIAGLGGSLALIANAETRKKFVAAHHAVSGIAPNAIAVAAAEAAWTSGDRWLDAALEYIGGNYELLKGFLAERLPKMRVFPLEGTYLALLDMRGLGLDNAELKERLLQKARVWLDEGTKFGQGGERMQRMNLACPRSTLRDALERMERVFG